MPTVAQNLRLCQLVEFMGDPVRRRAFEKFDARGPLKWGFIHGYNAGASGMFIEACPYVESLGGQVTFRRACGNAWRAGWKAGQKEWRLTKT